MDDALGEQYLEDLQDTKDKEQSILDERIKNLDLYIQALQYRNEEADRILRDRLIMEMMNLNNMEDVQDAILEDWNKFNEYSEGSFKYYDGIFNEFMDSYRDNVLELDNIQKQFQEVLSSTMSGILGQNNQNIQMGINNTGNISEAMGMSAEDQAALTAAGKKYTIAQNAYLSSTDENLKAQLKQAMEQAHAEAEAIRAKYGYSGGADGSALIVTDKGLYSQYMGNGYKDQMQTEENFLSFYDNLFGDFGDLEDDRLSGISSFANGLANNYNQVNSQNNSYLSAEGTFLDEHNYNGQYQSSINDSIIQDWLMYVNDAGVSYDYVIMDFQSFLDKYRAQIEEYSQLQNMLAGSMNSGLGGNYVISGSGGSTSSGMAGDASNWGQMSAADQAALNAAGDKYNQAAEMYKQTGNQIYKDMMDAAHKEAESIRNKYGYSGGADGSLNINLPRKTNNTITTASNNISRISQDISDLLTTTNSMNRTVKTSSYNLSTLSDFSNYLSSGSNYAGDGVYATGNDIGDLESILEDAGFISTGKLNSTNGYYGNTNTPVVNNSTNVTTNNIITNTGSKKTSSSSGSSSSSSSSKKNKGPYEDVSNLPGGAYVQSDGTVYYPDGHPGAEIDLNRDGLPDSDWLKQEGAPSHVIIGNLMKEYGLSYEETLDLYKAKYVNNQKVDLDPNANNTHIAHNRDQYLIQSAKNAGWDSDKVDELINYLGNNGAEYNSELEQAIKEFENSMPANLKNTNNSIISVETAITNGTTTVENSLQRLGDLLEDQGIIIAGTSQMLQHNSNEYQNAIREEMEKDQATMDYESFVNKWGDKLIWNGDKMELPLYGDYDITNGGFDENGNPGFLGNSNATIGATGPSGTEWLGDKTFSQWLYSQGAPYYAWYSQKLKEEKQGIYWSADDYYQKNVMSKDDSQALKDAGEMYNEAQKKYEETGNAIYKQLMEQAHEQAEAIRNAYGYSGGADGSGYLQGIEDIGKAESEVNNDRLDGLNAFGNNLNDLWNYINDVSANGIDKELANNLAHENNANDLSNINKTLVDTWVKYNSDSKIQMDYANQSFEDFVNNYGSQINDFANLNNSLVNNMNSTVDSMNESLQDYKDLQDEWEKNYGSNSGYTGDYGEAVDPDDGYTGKDSSGGAVHPEKDDPSGNGVINSDGSWSPFPGGPVYSGRPSGGSSGSSGSKGSGGMIGDAISAVVDKNGNMTVTTTKPNGSSSSKTYGRDTSNAGKTVSKNGYKVTYNKNGYVTSTKKETPKRTGISKYAGGLEEGAVTYTGLAMLHGTPSKPEYVLNNDQAYNLLYNLSTNRLPEIEKDGENNGETVVYNIAEVNIDGTEDPADFWNTVMSAASNRHNVTKKGGSRVR